MTNAGGLGRNCAAVPDAPRPPRRLPHHVDRVVGLVPDDGGEFDQVEAGLHQSAGPNRHAEREPYPPVSIPSQAATAAPRPEPRTRFGG